MKKILLGQGVLEVPEIALGCMRINALDEKNAAVLVETALANGINFFDHADVYAGGEAEKKFTAACRLAGIPREKLILQTKCGICRDYYDFSKQHILESVNGSLRRLQTDYVDILLLHRPDTLMEPDEIAEAFQTLRQAGKVRFFGVSNQNPGQIALLRQSVREPIVANQLQLSITESGMIDAGINVNMSNNPGIDRDGGILEYCRLNGITIQPWSPFQYGFFAGVFIDSPLYPALNKKLDELAGKYSITKSAVAIAWLLRHPARMQPIVGTTKPQRLAEISKASGIMLTREEWYEVYRSSGKELP
jgi:predicted oxidoreductase